MYQLVTRDFACTLVLVLPNVKCEVESILDFDNISHTEAEELPDGGSGTGFTSAICCCCGIM